jgi:hypothetical protein
MVATGDTEGAASLVRNAMDGVDPTALPWLHAMLLVELARVHDARGDATAAAHAARDASRELAALDVAVADRDSTLLARLTPGADRPGAALPATLTPDARGWIVAHGGLMARLPDSKGLRYVAELVRRPGCERHALDLVDRVEGVDVDGGVDRRSLGDAGELIDSKARAAYRRRLECLRADVENALAADRLDDAEAIQNEIDQLVRELARAFGLGGRSRQASAVAERARLNVTRAIRAATARVADVVPAGRLLDARIRTGLYCAYEPVVDDTVRWIVQS